MQQSKFLNHPLDIINDFYELENEYFLAGEVKNFNSKKSEGKIEWN
jgi:hypothetical protein